MLGWIYISKKKETSLLRTPTGSALARSQQGYPGRGFRLDVVRNVGPAENRDLPISRDLYKSRSSALGATKRKFFFNKN